MAIRATSGPGYATANMSPWDAASGAMPAGGGGALGGLLDPNLLRQAMLEGLDMRRRGFEEQMAGRQQERYLAGEEGKREADTAKEAKGERDRRRRIESRGRAVSEPYERGARELGLERDVAQTRALTGRAPTRRVSVMGAGSFDTPDPLRMTGAQRMQFLPGGAGLSASPTRTDLAGLGSDVAFDAMLAGDRSRRRAGAPAY